jgi:hypothetical protein
MKINEKILMISLYNQCNNYREVGRAFKKTVKKLINRWESEGTVSRKVGSGFNRRTTVEEDENVIYTAVRREGVCDLDISCITVSQRLKSCGLNRRLAVQKEKLNENHIQNRLYFIRNYSDLTVDEWSQFIFTDCLSFRKTKLFY